MSKEYQLTAATLGEVFNAMQLQLSDNPHLIVTVQTPGTGKWGMARLWRNWMATTAVFMAKNGCTMPFYQLKNGDNVGVRPFNADDAHDAFTRKWLGEDENGLRLSWAKSSKDGSRAATVGERFNAMRQHEQYAIDRNIPLMQPRGSEYEQLRNQ